MRRPAGETAIQEAAWAVAVREAVRRAVAGDGAGAAAPSTPPRRTRSTRLVWADESSEEEWPALPVAGTLLGAAGGGGGQRNQLQNSQFSVPRFPGLQR